MEWYSLAARVLGKVGPVVVVLLSSSPVCSPWCRVFPFGRLSHGSGSPQLFGFRVSARGSFVRSGPWGAVPGSELGAWKDLSSLSGEQLGRTTAGPVCVSRLDRGGAGWVVGSRPSRGRMSSWKKAHRGRRNPQRNWGDLEYALTRALRHGME